MLFRQFGLISYPGGAHAPPSLQPCPSFTSCTTQRPVVFNTAPPPVNTPVCTPFPLGVSIFSPTVGRLALSWYTDPHPYTMRVECHFPLPPVGDPPRPGRPLPPPPPPPDPLVTRPMYQCFPSVMGYPLRTGTRPDSTPRLSATAPGHGVWGDHFCDVHFVAKFTTLHRPAAAVTPACRPADP